MSNEARWRRAADDYVIDMAAAPLPYALSAAGSMGAAPATPETPRLLGPDGNPLPETPPLPFGFTA